MFGTAYFVVSTLLTLLPLYGAGQQPPSPEDLKKVAPPTIPGARASQAKQAQHIALTAYLAKAGGLMATEDLAPTAVVTLGYDVPGFAKSGDRIWEVRALWWRPDLTRALRSILWVHSETSQVYFLTGVWQASGESPGSGSSPSSPRVLRTVELRNQWKATLFSRPFLYTLRMGDREIPVTNTLYYVEVTTPDSKTPRRVWQHLFAMTPSAPQSIPRSFIFGPGDEHQLCLAALQAFTVYFFVLDTRANLPPQENAVKAVDSHGQSARFVDYDPNAIPLRQALGKEFDRLLAEKEMQTAIDGVSCCANQWTIHLSVGKQQLVLRCPPGGKKPAYQVFELAK